MQAISAVAEFERDLLLERTHAGIVRAKASGNVSAAHPLNEEQKKAILLHINEEKNISTIAREFSTTQQIILRVKATMGDTHFALGTALLIPCRIMPEANISDIKLY